MKRIWLVVLLLLPGTLRAQSNSAAGNLTAQGASCIATNCVSLRYQPNTIYATITLSGTWSATVQFEVSGDYGVTWVAAPGGTTSSTSNGTTQFSVGGYTMMRARVSAFTSGTVSVTIIGSTQSVSTTTINNIGGAGSNFSGGTVIDATISPYNVVTGFIATDCTFTSGQPTVSCTTTVPSTTMIGWIVKATNGCCGNANQMNGVHEFASGTTILSVNAGTKTFTLSTNALGSVSPGYTNGSMFGAGPDMTTNLAAAYTAAVAGVNCKALILPSGPVFIKKGQFNGPASCNFPISGGSSTPDAQHQIQGWGAYTSLLVMAEGFDFTTGNGNSCGGDVAFTTCFGGVQATRMYNWGVTALSDSAVGGSTNLNIFSLGIDSQMFNMGCFGVGANNSHITGLNIGPGAQAVDLAQWDGCGAVSLNAADTTGPAVVTNSFFGNSNPGLSGTLGVLTVANASQLQSSNNGFFTSPASSFTAVVAGGQFYSSNDNFFETGAAGVVMNVLTNGNANISNGNLACTSGACGVLAVQNAGRASLQNTTLNAGGLGSAFVVAGTGQVIDACGNRMLAGTSNSGMFGTCSITGTALVTGNIGLTSGWGTSSVASVQAGSDSHRGRFTITGAAGSASPTLTLTFPKAYWVGAPPATCNLFENTTDLVSLTSVASGTPTATAVVFTFAGTPTTATYIFDYLCGP